MRDENATVITGFTSFAITQDSSKNPVYSVNRELNKQA